MKLNELRDQFRKAEPKAPAPEPQKLGPKNPLWLEPGLMEEGSKPEELPALALPATMSWENMKNMVRRDAIDRYGWPEEGTLVYRSDAGAVVGPDRPHLSSADSVHIGAPGYTGSLVHPRIEVEGFTGEHHRRYRSHTKLRFHIPRHRG